MISEVSLQDYLDYIWPPLPHSLKNHVDSVVKILEDSGTIHVPNDRWAAFPVDPAKATEREGVVFQGLTTIFDAVVAASKQVDLSLEQTFSLIVNGNVAMYSDRGASSRPDGFNKLYSKTQGEQQQGDEATGELNTRAKPQKNVRHFVHDLANPNQYKLGDAQNDEDDDFAKLVYDMEQILALDPCRRFTFGTTIENRSTRLWFLSRATLLRTKPFDFMKERRQLVIIFLSLAFSHLDQMGWDPTIAFSHVDKSGHRQYRIKINDQTYTTIDVLSDSAAHSPLGRATRVWKVKDSSDKIRVLKDVWLESDRLEEHKIREAILADAKTLNQRKEHSFDTQLEKRMLRPMDYCRVRVGDEEDDTGAVMLRSFDLGKAQLVHLITPRDPPAVETQSVAMSMPTDRDSAKDSASQSGTHQTKRPLLRRIILEDAQQQASHHHRYHYRIVFEQCATTIYDERSLANVFRAIVEVVKALYVLHTAGWVHRDISGGNVYWFNDEQIGLIGDFEYATRMTDRGHHNVRTGTPFFMALETLANGYLFTTPTRKLSNDSQTDLDFDLVKIKNVSKIRAVGPIVPFTYNPLHDLESVWWLIIYVLFFNDDEMNSSNDPTYRQLMMQELFHGRLDVNGRLVFFRDFHRLPDAHHYLSPSFRPALEILTELADVLNTAYVNSERTFPTQIDNQCFKVHKDFLVPLLSEEYIDSLVNITLIQVKENPKKRTNSEVERPTKRSRISLSQGLNGHKGGSRSRRSTQPHSSLRN